jgi:RNA polymerase sigma factor (sigma-70 family)
VARRGARLLPLLSAMDSAAETRSPQLVENLFRHESGRMLAALLRILGLHNFDLAEDVVQDTLVRALETWRFRVPANPGAWLMLTARNGALDVVRRERSARRFAPELSHLLDSEWTLVGTLDELFLDSEIRDDQLRMMFSCCHPRLAPEVQVALILKILCGFGTDEIARAFLTEPATVEKRIGRGKQALRESGTLYEIRSDPAILDRLDAVLATLYLLFNEGYHGSHPELPIRSELCAEAMRLLAMLLEHRTAAAPRAVALLALMCFHAARLQARLDDAGSLILLEAQERGRWDVELIRRGVELLERAAEGDRVSEFHLEAAIAAKHCLAPRYEETDWRGIVGLYDLLMGVKPTPIVALNRAIAVGQLEGPAAGLAALQAIPQAGLEGYPFFAAALGEMHRRAGRGDQAAEHYRTALAQARSPAEAAVFRQRLASCASS